jgi:uncharacterized protein YcnI
MILVRRFGAALALAAVAVVLSGGAAAAHVTVSPSSLPQGTSDAVLTFRVPNESATASVTGVRVQFPLAHPIVVVNPEAGSGWTVSVHTTRLANPITTDDGTFTSTTSEVDWTGSSIPVGQFGEFSVLAQGIPSGTPALVFKAIQSYSDGSVVSWIEVPDRAVPAPAHPAPTITLTAPGGRTSTTDAAAPQTGAGATAVVPASGTNALAVAALILAGFATLLAVLAVWLGRPRFGSRTPDDAAGSIE